MTNMKKKGNLENFSQILIWLIEHRRVELLSNTYKVFALPLSECSVLVRDDANANLTATTGLFSSLTDYIVSP